MFYYFSAIAATNYNVLNHRKYHKLRHKKAKFYNNLYRKKEETSGVKILSSWFVQLGDNLRSSHWLDDFVGFTHDCISPASFNFPVALSRKCMIKISLSELVYLVVVLSLWTKSSIASIEIKAITCKQYFPFVLLCRSLFDIRFYKVSFVN